MSIIDGLLAPVSGKITLALMAGCFAAGGALGWHERVLREPAMIEAQKKVDVKACTDQQDKLKEKNDALVEDRDRISADAARYKRVHPDTCIYPRGTGQLQQGAGQRAGVYGISTDWLRDYAAMCETYRSEVIVCTGQSAE